MFFQFGSAVPALVVAVSCLGLLRAQVLDHSEDNLGHPEISPHNTDGSAAAQQPPHLILIVADDLGWNDVSWYNPAVLSPHLGQLAEEGVILSRSYVQPICTPTRSALLTSRYPFTMGRQNNVLGEMTPTGLSLDVSLLPEELHKLGYETNMVGKWHLGFCKEEYTPTVRGFDTFFGYYNALEDYYSHMAGGYSDVPAGYDFRTNMTVNRDVEGIYSAFSFADRATSLLTERNPQKPLFLYLAFQSVHSPLQVPQNYSDLYGDIEDMSRRRYLGMVTAMDEAVGKVVASLKATGHYDNSVIVFTTDNGGATSSGANNSPLRGNKTTLWEGGTRGSAFIHSPLLSSPGTVSQRMIHVTDWFPTFLHLAGGSPPAGIDGVNQWEVLNDGLLADARDHFVYDIDDTNGLRAAVRWNEYKLIVGDPGVDGWKPSQDLDENKASHPSELEKSCNHKIPDENKENSQTVDAFVEEESINLSSFESTRVDRQEKTTWASASGSTLKIEDIRSVSQLLNSNETIQLYNVIDDPSEQDDISEEHTDIVILLVERLLEELTRYVAKDIPADDPKADPSNFDSTWSPGWC